MTHVAGDSNRLIGAESNLDRGPGRSLLDDSVVAQIAAELTTVPDDAPASPMAITAFESLGLQSERVFAQLTGGVHAFRVVFSLCGVPYSSDDEMISAVRETGVLEVASVCSTRDRLHPILDNQLGGSYDKFRAVHDLTGHVATGYGFDREGEISAWVVQDRLYTGMARLALGSELFGENCFRWMSGTQSPHRSVLIDPRTLEGALEQAKQ